MKFNILLLSQLFLCASTSHKRDQEFNAIQHPRRQHHTHKIYLPQWPTQLYHKTNRNPYHISSIYHIWPPTPSSHVHFQWNHRDSHSSTLHISHWRRHVLSLRRMPHLTQPHDTQHTFNQTLINTIQWNKYIPSLILNAIATVPTPMA